MFRRMLLLAITFSAAGLAQSGASPAGDPWAQLRFLIGTWNAKTTTGDVKGVGTYTFAPELNNHVLVRRSVTVDCKGPADYDCQHGDILYIYRDSPDAALKAIYFDNEGHVIHYNVTTPAADTAVFLTDPSQAGPQFQLVYHLADGLMSGKFQIKPPGQSEFHSYLEWSGGRK